ncbi:MAG: FtsX-like permease family protein [Spirochaetaceae bacterium]|jgi:putative ABC transport system permease protein|nr:FtsX-like permease family protein [Spirochaetaceae bacterium]
MIFQLATRNLLRNKRNSLVVFSLYFVITLLFFMVNSFMGEINQGMQRRFIDNFTGHLVLKAPTSVEVRLFGSLTPTIHDFYTLPPLPQKNEIQSQVESLDFVKDTTGLVTGAAVMDLLGQRLKLPIFGVEGDDYFQFFPGIEMVEGHSLESYETGVMISQYRREEIEGQTGKKLTMGMPVKLTMAGERGFKIREVPLAGIFQYEQRDPLLDQLLLCDLQTLRALNSITLGVSDSQEIQEDESSLLDSDWGSLFGGQDQEAVDASADQEELFSDDLFGGGDLFDGTGDTSEDTGQAVDPNEIEGLVSKNQDSSNWQGGSWHFLLIKLKPQTSYNKALRQLEAFIQTEEFPVEVLQWREAAGLSARLVFLLQLFYNVGFLLVALTGGIAMVNILLISLFERTSELGTLRAMGAQKSYLRRLILLENLILAGFGSISGILMGALALLWINRQNIQLTNEMLVSLLGMEQLHFTPQLKWAILSLIMALILGAFASLYPLVKAMKIEPAVAQGRGK